MYFMNIPKIFNIFRNSWDRILDVHLCVGKKIVKIICT